MTFFSVVVAMLKQALFNHMLSREAEEETEENRQGGAPGGQLSACLPGSAEGPSATSDLFAESQKDNQPPSGQTGLSETTESNGEAVLKKFSGGEFDENIDTTFISVALK